MSGRDYRAKFAAYYAYWASGHYERDYDGFPTLLVVISGPGRKRGSRRHSERSGSAGIRRCRSC